MANSGLFVQKLLRVFLSTKSKPSMFLISTDESFDTSLEALTIPNYPPVFPRSRMPPFADESNMRLSPSSAHSCPTGGKIRCVFFDLKPNVHEIESWHDMPYWEVEETWYSEKEKKEMISSATAVLTGANTEDLRRGLEKCSPDAARRRRVERSNVSAAVLGEQLRQHAAKCLEGTATKHGDILIAIEYSKVSQQHKEAAIQQAKIDAAEARGEAAVSRPFSAVKRWWGRPSAQRSHSTNQLL
jgi:hypothetical protein